MSVHVEWVPTAGLITEVVPAGSFIGEFDVGAGGVGLVLHYDEAVVIEGYKEELRGVLTRALEQLEKVEPTDPVPPDYRGEE